MASAAVLFSLLSVVSSAQAFTLELEASDSRGRVLDSGEFLRHIAPNSQVDTGVAPAQSGIFLTDLSGAPVSGRPWWVKGSTTPTLSWNGAGKVRLSLPWPVTKDGFSTLILDGGGKGYLDGQKIFLNEEAAMAAYQGMRRAMSVRKGAGWTPPYSPSKEVEAMADAAKDLLAEAKAQKRADKRAKAFDKALTACAFAWQQVLFDYGRQKAADEKTRARLRFGLSLDETIAARVNDQDEIVDNIADSGADWVRVVFVNPPGDFAYENERSFTIYDSLVKKLAAKKIRIMGSALDSMLWPSDLTPELYQKRVANLAMRYRDSIRSWEIASEPNADWLGGTSRPLPDETILLAVQKAVVAVKRVDASLETVATLHWWEGTAGDDKHALFPWLDWAASRGFGKGVDVMALSVYPHRHPLGMAFDPVFLELSRRFPDKKLMLGGFSFSDEKKNGGYWWLNPKAVDEARKDLLVLYAGVAASAPNSIGGGFYWGTLRWMLPEGKRPTGLYRLHQNTVKRMRK